MRPPLHSVTVGVRRGWYINVAVLTSNTRGIHRHTYALVVPRVDVIILHPRTPDVHPSVSRNRPALISGSKVHNNSCLQRLFDGLMDESGVVTDH